MDHKAQVLVECSGLDMQVIGYICKPDVEISRHLSRSDRSPLNGSDFETLALTAECGLKLAECCLNRLFKLITSHSAPLIVDSFNVALPMALSAVADSSG